MHYQLETKYWQRAAMPWTQSSPLSVLWKVSSDQARHYSIAGRPNNTVPLTNLYSSVIP